MARKDHTDALAARVISKLGAAETSVRRRNIWARIRGGTAFLVEARIWGSSESVLGTIRVCQRGSGWTEGGIEGGDIAADCGGCFFLGWPVPIIKAAMSQTELA